MNLCDNWGLINDEKVLVHNDAVSRKHLALEVIVTLAENASGMIRKNAAKYIPMIG